MQIKTFTAFSGYDSQCLALQKAGIDYQLVGWSEIDKYAITAHNAIFPECSTCNFNDITSINWDSVPDLDLFTYSFPCQDISSVGNQRGLSEGSGTRSSLLWECGKAIEAKKPKYLLMENVKTLTQKKFMSEFQKWQDYLMSLGYTNYWKVLNAKDYNVPQNRERVFMVSIYGQHEKFQFPEKISSTRKLKDVLEESVDAKYYLKPKQVKNMLMQYKQKAKSGLGYRFNLKTRHNIANTIVSSPSRHLTDNWIVENEIDSSILSYSRDAQGKVVPRHIKELANTLHGAGGNTSQYVIRYPHGAFKGGLYDSKVSPTITTSAWEHNNHIMCVSDISHSRLRQVFESGKIDPTKITFIDAYNDKLYDSITPTITTRIARCNHYWVSEPCEDKAFQAITIRRLTPRECFRLMDVDETNIDKLLTSGVSDTQLYKLAGNSIVVACLKGIFENLLK